MHVTHIKSEVSWSKMYILQLKLFWKINTEINIIMVDNMPGN
jgi:hypothetical protein